MSAAGWRHPAAKHAHLAQWHPFDDPWMFAYTCKDSEAAAGGRSKGAAERARAELEVMRNAAKTCPSPSQDCQVQGWASLFDPAVHWTTFAVDD